MDGKRCASVPPFPALRWAGLGRGGACPGGLGLKLVFLSRGAGAVGRPAVCSVLQLAGCCGTGTAPASSGQ